MAEIIIVHYFPTSPPPLSPLSPPSPHLPTSPIAVVQALPENYEQFQTP